MPDGSDEEVFQVQHQEQIDYLARRPKYNATSVQKMETMKSNIAVVAPGRVSIHAACVHFSSSASQCFDFGFSERKRDDDDDDDEAHSVLQDANLVSRGVCMCVCVFVFLPSSHSRAPSLSSFLLPSLPLLSKREACWSKNISLVSQQQQIPSLPLPSDAEAFSNKISIFFSQPNWAQKM